MNGGFADLVSLGQLIQAHALSPVPHDGVPVNSKLRPSDPAFVQAGFHSAAESYRRLLENSPDQLSRVVDYATALSAENKPSQALSEFNVWFRSLRSPTIAAAARARIERIGLNLMAGNSSALDCTLAQARAAGVSAFDPDSLSRLGWWCYRAGRYSTAADFLKTAAQASGDRTDAVNVLGWVEIEQGSPDAARDFADPMGRAVAWWRAHRPEEALKDFAVAADATPQWLNPKWVKALYSARVEQSIVEMQAARARRARHGVR